MRAVLVACLPLCPHALWWDTTAFLYALHFSKHQKEMRTHKRFLGKKQMKVEGEESLLLSLDGTNCQAHWGERYKARCSGKPHQRESNIPLWESDT